MDDSQPHPQQPVGAPDEPLPTANATRRALGRARSGVALDVTEAAVLLLARGADLAELSRIAARVRDAGLEAAGRPGVITYSRKVFIPLTRLCRDRCHYCTFATAPGRLRREGHGMYLSPDEVVDIARRGAALGCKEALFTLGDRPEDRWPQARAWLDAHGYDDTLAYLRAMAIRVLEETGLLPHLNPGVLSWTDLQRLKPVAPSMGMMLETTATRLWSEPCGPHHGSPDKEPAVRLRVLEDAGRCNVPFTTGVLIGIGETTRERAESLFALRRVARLYHGVQEVIVQNFRAKPGTVMRGMPDAELDALVAAVAVARLVLGPAARVQAPPNLVDGEYAALIDAGIDDWGGVSPLTPDHVNPERPWPQIERLAAHTAASGFTLRERLTVYPEFIARGEPWLDPRLLPHVRALADPETGLAREDAVPVGLPWQEPDEVFTATGRTDLHRAIDTEGRSAERRDDFDEVYGDWEALREQTERPGAAPPRLDLDVRGALATAADDPTRLTDDEALALLHADGPALDALCRIADAVRHDTVGDDVTYIVTRNINFTNVCYTGCRFCAFAQRRTDADAYTLSLDQVADRAEQAWQVGATEVCMQGGIHPDLPGTAYFDIARAVKERVPGIHVHAFSPMEVVNGASRTGMPVREWLAAAKEAGLGSLPGTAAEILDDEVRWILTKGKLPAATWVEVVRTAHELGLRTSSTMMYGHVDQPRHWLGHLRLLAQIQRETGGFTEFVTLPFIHTNAPVYLAGIARPGPTSRDNLAVTAMARLLLHPHIPQHPDQLGEAGRRGRRADAAQRRQRPGRHPDGGDHLPHGRLGLRLLPLHPRPGRDRRGGRPPGTAARHALRRGVRRAAGDRAGARRPAARPAAAGRRLTGCAPLGYSAAPGERRGAGVTGIWGRAQQQDFRARVRGCLLGGAVGDALGAGVEFASLEDIRAAHGEQGVTDYVPAFGRRGTVTDDTQMAMFTTEGLIRAHVRREAGHWHPPTDVHRAYLRWAATQADWGPDERRKDTGWLAHEEWLYARRAPGRACLSGLGDDRMGTLDAPKNPDSKGCGTVTRSAPFGLLVGWEPSLVFQLAVECATQTHGHPTGYLAAGAFAVVVHALAHAEPLEGAVHRALGLLAGHPGHEETTGALLGALRAVRLGSPGAERVEDLGEGRTADEALAIGVYCALVAEDARHGLLLAVNHSGDSDATGSVCGNLLGVQHGETALPPAWVVGLEGRGTLLALADDFAMEMTQAPAVNAAADWLERYPPA